MSDAPQTLQNGRYRIEGILGSGGMSVVYLAFDTRLNVRRAVKVLRKRLASNTQIRKRFETEASAQASLHHPNVLMVHDVVDDEDGVYLVMELCENGNLAERLKATGPLSPHEGAEVALAMLGALQIAHDEGMVHRDIKPENLLLNKLNVLKIADFGIARIVNQGHSLTKTGSIMGTWSYMPPEQRSGSSDVDGRADLYALGVSIQYLVSGQLRSDLHNAEAYDVAYEGFPEELAEVLQQATRLWPEDRYQSATEMAEAIQTILPVLSKDPIFPFAPGPKAEPSGRTAVPESAPGLSTIADTYYDEELAQTEVYEAPVDPPQPSTNKLGRLLLMFGAGFGGLLFTLALGALLLPPLLFRDPAPSRPDAISSSSDVGSDAAGTNTVGGEGNGGEGAGDDGGVVTTEDGSGTAEGSDSDDGSPSTSATEGTGEDAGEATGPNSGSGGADPGGSSMDDGGGSGPRIITVQVPTGSGSTSDDSVPDLPDGPTGTVRVRTVPTGATASVDGTELTRVGSGYVLSVGNHLLDIRSPQGETVRIPVHVKRGQNVDICYSFDTNSACTP